MRNIIFLLIGALVLGGALIFFINLQDGEVVPDEVMNGTEGGEVIQVSLPTPTETWECTADAKICPDGSAVGRTGPKCEFMECPSVDASSDTVSTYLGGSVTRFNLTVNPQEVISDSRCPKDVQCIWAGTVEVRTVVSSQTGHGELTFKLGEPRTVGDFTVTLVEVTPETKADVTIPEHSYWFTFEIQKSLRI